jgi:MFS family permease
VINIVENEKSGMGRLMSSSLIIMILTHTLVHAAGNMRDTLFPLLKLEFSLTNQQIGLIVAIPSLLQFLFSVPSGIISDRFGARKLIAASIMIAAAGAFLGSVSTTPLMFILASTLLTLNSTLYHPPAQRYISDIASPRDRSRILGIWFTGGTTGVSLGPLSITILMGALAFTWRQIYSFWVIPILLGLVGLYFLKPPAEMVEKEVRESWGEEEAVDTLFNSNMILLLVSGTVRRFGGGLTAGFMTIWLAEAQGWNIGQIGMMLAASSLVGLVASPLGGELAYRFGDKKLFVATLFGSYAFFALAFVLKGYWPFMLAYITHRFFGILGMPASMTLTSRLSPPKQRGVGFALSSIPENVMRPVAAILAAFIADAYGLYPIFIVTSVIYFIGLGILQFGVRIEE